MKKSGRFSAIWGGMMIIGLTACGYAVAQQGEHLFGIEGAPTEFMEDNYGVIMTASPQVVNEVCRNDKTPEDTVILACTLPKERVMIMPNPCLWNDVDPYARLLCHEMAHLPQKDGGKRWVHDAAG